MDAKQMSIFDRGVSPKKLTQTERVLKYMKDFGGITPIDAMKDLGVMRLGARIYDLEKEGVRIIHETVEDVNRYGQRTHYCRYFLAHEH